MTDIGAADGVEGWLRSAKKRLDSMERSIMRGRVPRTCTSTTRPRPSAMQPGVSLFEMDTNRTIFVNAGQTGYVNASGSAV